MKHASVLVLVALLVLAMVAMAGLGPTMAATREGEFSLEGPQPDRGAAALARVSSVPLERGPQGAMLQAGDVAPLMFIENVGLFADGARFQLRCAAGTVWLADDALWLSLVDTSETGTA